MTVVVDASLVVAGLTDRTETGTWARHRLAEAHLMAPHLLPVEVTNVLRRLESRGQVGASAAAAGVRDLLDLGVELLPFEPFAERVWQLRAAVSAYDAWYVAVAETLGVPLLTLDRGLGRARVRCDVVTPDG
jgi:predicted nucleic acid-binding protein